jgi:hypothetical protein
LSEPPPSWLPKLPEILASAYKNKPSFSAQLLEAYREKEYLQFANDLATNLVKKGVVGVEEKLTDADNLSKFDSAIAELQIATLLAQNGKKVQLLSDNVWEGPSPDMIASENSLESYIEVKRMTDDGAANRVSNGLRELLPGLARPVRVDVTLKDGLVVPVTTFAEINGKNEKGDESLKLLREQLQSADLTRLPIVIQTPAADFTLLPTSQPEGYPGITTTPTFSVPEKQLIQKMISDVEMKAKKRESWKGERRGHPYIVALTDEFAWTDYDMAKSAFLGDVTIEVGGPWSNPTTHPKVSIAAERGWDQYLKEEYLIPDEKARCYLLPGKEGAFFTNEMMNNVSAVLLRVITGRYYLLPNPFAHEEINAPELYSYLNPRISGF